MALLNECMLKCAPILIDTADIVREAILRQLRAYLLTGLAVNFVLALYIMSR